MKNLEDEFAPVIIPTLCRYHHLRNLLDSLARNSLAGSTEIYISVDYPPSEKYVIDREILCNFLTEYDFSAFKAVHVFYQEKNLGAALNSRFLINAVSKSHAKYIFTEDDNVVSQNFLEYMNWGLKEFKEDERVLSINSCNNYGAISCSSETNVLLSKMYVPYGIGKWAVKDIKDEKRCAQYLLNKENWTLKNLLRLFKQNAILCQIYLRQILFTNDGFFYISEDELWCCDTVITIYMYLSNRYCILPVTSKSLTKGNDGSGNMSINKALHEPMLDDNNHFAALFGGSFEYNMKNNRLAYKHLRTIFKPHRFTTLFFIFMLFIKRKNRNKMIAWNKRLMKFVKRLRRQK